MMQESGPDVVSQTAEKLHPIRFQSESIFTKFKRKLRQVAKNITLEPVMLFISFVSSMDRVSIGQLLIDKSCDHDFDYNATVCENIHDEEYEDAKAEVEIEVAQYKVYESIIDHLFPVICSFFLGSWSDTFGRKILLYLYFGFRVIEGSMLWLNAYFMEWPKEYMLFSVNTPVALSGGWLAFSMGINAFVADISPPEQRSFRMAMMHFVSSLGRPFGTQMGKWLYFAGGYQCVIGATVLGRLLGFAFLVIRLEMFKWKPKPKPEDPAKPNAKKHHALSPMHIIDSLKTACRKRPNGKRMYLWIYLMVMISIVLPFFGESTIGYNYVMTRYNWGPGEYSDYTTIAEIIDIVGQSICIPVLGVLKIRDSLLIPFLLCTIIARDFIKAFAKYEWMYYLGGAINIMGGYSFAASRSIVSKCVESNELGKVFALLSSMESLVPIGMSQAYASIWEATSKPGSPYVGTVFIVSGALTSIALLLSIFSLFKLRGNSIVELDAEPACKPRYRNMSFEVRGGRWALPPRSVVDSGPAAPASQQTESENNHGHDFIEVDLTYDPREEVDSKTVKSISERVEKENDKHDGKTRF